MKVKNIFPWLFNGKSKKSAICPEPLCQANVIQIAKTFEGFRQESIIDRQHIRDKIEDIRVDIGNIRGFLERGLP